MPTEAEGVEDDEGDEEMGEEEEEEEEVMVATRGRKERRDSVTESIVKGASKVPTRSVETAKGRERESAGRLSDRR